MKLLIKKLNFYRKSDTFQSCLLRLYVNITGSIFEKQIHTSCDFTVKFYKVFCTKLLILWERNQILENHFKYFEFYNSRKRVF